MGVKDLMAWIKRRHPQVISSLPARFASPKVRGRAIAIDGTLITNRFHFAQRRRMDQRAEHALRGWYALITEMRAQGMTPVVIWDEKGDRPWKAPEARRRLQARATALARKLHEDRRALRLGRLKREIERFGCLSVREQDAIRLWWRLRCDGDNDSGGSTPGASIPSVSAATSATLSNNVPTDAQLVTSYIVARFSAHLHRLRWLADSYDMDADPRCRPGCALSLFEAFEAEEEEVCRIALGDGEEVERELQQEAQLWADDSEEIMRALEARLRALEPASTYTESPRQHALTEGEGEVFELAFGSGGAAENGTETDATVETDMSATAATATSTTITAWTPSPTDLDPALALTAALAQIETLQTDAAVVRSTYVSNLLIPLDSEHAACRALLSEMGVAVVLAPVPYEAEGWASAMALRGAVDFVGTEDSDVIAYGAPLLRNLSTPTSPLVLVDSARLPRETGLSREAFRDFCVLLGTDASPRIPGIGPAAASALVEKYGTIEMILASEADIPARLKRLFRPDAPDADDGDDTDGDDAGKREAEGGVENGRRLSEEEPQTEREKEEAARDMAKFMAMVHSARQLFDDTLLPAAPSLVVSEYTPAQDAAVRAWLMHQHGIVLRAAGRAPENEPEALGLGRGHALPEFPEDGKHESRPWDGEWDEVWDAPAPAAPEMPEWESVSLRL